MLSVAKKKSLRSFVCTHVFFLIFHNLCHHCQLTSHLKILPSCQSDQRYAMTHFAIHLISHFYLNKLWGGSHANGLLIVLLAKNQLRDPWLWDIREKSSTSPKYTTIKLVNWSVWVLPLIAGLIFWHVPEKLRLGSLAHMTVFINHNLLLEFYKIHVYWMRYQGVHSKRWRENMGYKSADYCV